MQKKWLIIVFAVLGLFLTGCSEKAVMLDLKAVDVDMSVYHGFSVSEHQFKKVTMKESLRLFDEKGSGIVYYGYKTCPYCVQAVPVMNEVAKENNQTIYYVDIESEDGNTEADINRFLELAKDHLQKNEKGEPEFYVPQVFVFKNGKIVGDHLGAVDSYNPNSGNMTPNQVKELKGIYTKIFKKLK